MRGLYQLRSAAIIATLWLVLPQIYSFCLFSTLIATHQIKYSGIIHDRHLPLIYALRFDYTSASILNFTPLVGFTSGIFIAVNPTTTSARSGVLRHELRHVWQFALMGPLRIYTSFNTFHHLLGYDYWSTYLSNPFERDAYRFSNEQAKYNELIDQHAPSIDRLRLS